MHIEWLHHLTPVVFFSSSLDLPRLVFHRDSPYFDFEPNDVITSFGRMKRNQKVGVGRQVANEIWVFGDLNLFGDYWDYPQKKS